MLYVLVAAVFTGVVPQARMSDLASHNQPLTFALQEIAADRPWMTTLVALGAVVAQMVTLLVYQLGQPRIFLAMARDGLLPPIFSRIHPRYRTPHVTTVATGMAVAIVATFASIDELIDLTNIGTLFAFTLVCLGIPILRHLDPARPRPFRVPGGAYLLPLLGAAACLGLMRFLPSTSWWRFLGWLGLGSAVYVAYGLHHSVLGQRLGPPLPRGRCLALALALAGGGIWLILTRVHGH